MRRFLYLNNVSRETINHCSVYCRIIKNVSRGTQNKKTTY